MPTETSPEPHPADGMSAEKVQQIMDFSERHSRLAVLMACEAIGYGRVMQIAADAWREKDPVGALTVGPCAGAQP